MGERFRSDGEARDRRRLIVVTGIFVAGLIAFFQVAERIDIEGWLESIADGLGDWIFPLVGVLAFLETGAFVGLVAPGETAVILGGALTAKGDQSLELMLAVVWLSAWAGDSVSFLIGRRLGRGFVIRHGPRMRITPERLEQVEEYFGRHGGKTIVIGRFIGIVRALAPFIAGSSGVRYGAFVPYSILGTGLWAATFTLLGYFGADALNRVTELSARGSFLFGTVVAVGVAIFVFARHMRVPENRERIKARLSRTRLGRTLLPQLRFVWHRLTPGRLGLEFTTLLAAISVALFVLVAYASIVDVDPGPTRGDAEALRIVGGLEASWLTSLAEWVAALGSLPATLAVALVAGAGLAVTRRWAELGVLVAAVAGTHVALLGFDAAFDRPAPGDSLIAGADPGFPSAFAAQAIIYPWLALTLTLRLRPRTANASALVGAGIALAVLIGLSRVYLRVEYISDVNAGWGLGVAAFAGSAAIAMLIAHLATISQNGDRGRDRPRARDRAPS